MLESKINTYFNEHKNEILSYSLDSPNIEFEFSNHDEKHIVDIYINDKLVLKASYEIIGVYNIISSIWIWGWSLPYIEKDLVKSSNKIKKLLPILLNYECEKDKDYDTIEKYIYYCKNPSFFISYKNLDDIIKFSLFFTKKLWIIPHNLENKKIEYILLKKILQER